MAILAFLDASGTKQERVLCVGGFVGKADAWGLFEPAWIAVLNEFGVKALHMKDLTSWQGEFKSWNRDESRRVAFMAKLTAVLRRSALTSLGVALVVKEHAEVNHYFRVKENLGGPCAYTAMTAIALAFLWKLDKHPREPIAYFLERGDAGQGEIQAIAARMGFAPPITPLPKMDEFGNYYYPLQAADFIAYELAKALKTSLKLDSRAIPVWKSLGAMVDGYGLSMPLWKHVRANHLLELCGKLGVPRR